MPSHQQHIYLMAIYQAELRGLAMNAEPVGSPETGGTPMISISPRSLGAMAGRDSLKIL